MSRKLRWSIYLALGFFCLALAAYLQFPVIEDDAAFAAVPRRQPALAAYHKKIDKLAPHFDRMPKPEEGDWLAKYPEGGQTFDQYVAGRQQPIRADYQEIHLLPLGEFTPAEEKLLKQTGEFMQPFFGMKVRILDRFPLENIPDEAQRPRDDGRRQLLTTYLLDDVLKPRRSKKAAALLGFVAEDLWPGKGWNYVFGQASLQERVGVWSLFRNGDSTGDEAEVKLCLLRTLKTAVHETGHMLGILHCIGYSCCMNGSNHLDESDRKPLEFCPECQAKLWWTCRVDPVPRFDGLTKFAAEAGLKEEAEFWRELKAALDEP